MKTLVYRKDGKNITVVPTVLKTIQELAAHNDGRFTDTEVIRVISEQGWVLQFFQITEAIAKLKIQGHVITREVGDKWVYDVAVRVGKVSKVVAVEISCPECGGACMSACGSYMVDETDHDVTCEDCGLTVIVPLNAFRAPQ